MLPTFLIIGAAKAGTTSLADYLDQHSAIYMSEPKEPSFFRLEYDQGLDFYQHKYFKNWRRETQVGEAAQRNLFLPYVPQRIFESLPDARLIVLVRDPVERAFSHYLHDYQRGAYSISFEAAIEKDLVRLDQGPFFDSQNEYAKILDKDGRAPDHPTVLDSGCYAEQIQRYLKYFAQDRIQVILFEDFIADTYDVLNRVFEFLDVPEMRIQDTSVKNQQISKGAHKLMGVIGSIPGASRIPKSWRNNVKHIIYRKSAIEKPIMEEQTRKSLIQFYAPHNIRLETLTGLDLSKWQK